MEIKKTDKKNFIVGNLNIKQKDLENLPDQVIDHVVVNFPDNFQISLNNKYIKFNGCTVTCNEYNEFSLKTTSIPSNISLHSNIANVTNTIGAIDLIKEE
jgi:hypothetical protein